MHVEQNRTSGKGVAYAGIMAALSVICIVLSGVMEANSLFLLAAASFLVGSVQRVLGVKWSAAFGVGCFGLGVILAPQKLYCFTYLAFSVYVIVAEYFRGRDGRAEKRSHMKVWIVKGLVYHILLLVTLLLVWKLASFESFFSVPWVRTIYRFPVAFWIVMAVVAEGIWLVFDKAYLFFQEHYGHFLLPDTTNIK